MLHDTNIDINSIDNQVHSVRRIGGRNPSVVVNLHTGYLVGLRPYNPGPAVLANSMEVVYVDELPCGHSARVLHSTSVAKGMQELHELLGTTHIVSVEGCVPQCSGWQHIGEVPRHKVAYFPSDNTYLSSRRGGRARKALADGLAIPATMPPRRVYRYSV